MSNWEATFGMKAEGVRALWPLLNTLIPIGSCQVVFDYSREMFIVVHLEDRAGDILGSVEKRSLVISMDLRPVWPEDEENFTLPPEFGREVAGKAFGVDAGVLKWLSGKARQTTRMRASVMRAGGGALKLRFWKKVPEAGGYQRMKIEIVLDREIPDSERRVVRPSFRSVAIPVLPPTLINFAEALKTRRGLDAEAKGAIFGDRLSLSADKSIFVFDLRPSTEEEESFLIPPNSDPMPFPARLLFRGLTTLSPLHTPDREFTLTVMQGEDLGGNYHQKYQLQIYDERFSVKWMEELVLVPVNWKKKKKI